MSNPEFIIFTGPMFGSKTTRMLAALDRYTYQRKTIIAFKPKMDNRYSNSEISTHTGWKFNAIEVHTGDDIDNYLCNDNSTYDVIAVDEAFMIDGVSDILISMYRRGKTILVASLELSASCNVFNEIKNVMPWATKIIKCPAVCAMCDNDAYYTHRRINGLDEITVGGSELYEPRCWKHHNYMNVRLQGDNHVVDRS